MKINETENIKTVKKINKTRSWFFEKISKIEKKKSLAGLTKKKKGLKFLKSGIKEGTSLLSLQKQKVYKGIL